MRCYVMRIFKFILIDLYTVNDIKIKNIDKLSVENLLK